MRKFFSGAFKDNKYLSYGFLTGILRIAQESIFSGLNNLTVNSVMGQATANKIAESLYALDYRKLQDGIGEYMMKSISFYDSGAEGFYHGLVLGLVALMDDQYKIRSNRESGSGRYDISLIPRDLKYPGIIMELKSDKNLDEKKLEALSKEALKQIDDKGYETEMRAEGYLSELWTIWKVRCIYDVHCAVFILYSLLPVE